MEAALYVSLLLLVFLLSRAAASTLKAPHNALSQSETPAWVLRAARRAAPGARVREIRVEMEGEHAVRYRVLSETIDGKLLVFIANSTEEMVYERSGEAYQDLPEAVQRCIARCLPGFKPDLGSVRRLRGRRSIGYGIHGALDGKEPVELKISSDGQELLLTLSGRSHKDA